ncbi:hypothetical protein B0T20DRAFT_161370 [Sordaria brevicollis]|uniref:Uncharacterized protein n=1 Tax=Sordaria brevicollis TaxID=83679 RepID=A0AAE0PJU8_SORBR|nr:hypothetical protein B0T20DRAFT_161370 [Sordaria brevicollis]
MFKVPWHLKPTDLCQRPTVPFPPGETPSHYLVHWVDKVHRVLNGLVQRPCVIVLILLFFCPPITPKCAIPETCHWTCPALDMCLPREGRQRSHYPSGVHCCRFDMCSVKQKSGNTLVIECTLLSSRRLPLLLPTSRLEVQVVMPAPCRLEVRIEEDCQARTSIRQLNGAGTL